MRRLLIVRRISRREAVIAAVILLAAFVSGISGYLLAGGARQSAGQAEEGREILYWYDPMVPNERYPGPGKSSMGMELIPKYADEVSEGGITVSPSVQQNLGIRLARVQSRDIAPTVRAVARVQFDERLIQEVQTLTPGFVESLSVRAEGEPVTAGRVIAQVYSPELLTAEAEYKALLTSADAASRELRSAARNRLKLLGAPESLVRRLERGGTPQRTYPVVANASGVVTSIGARPGSQVALGQSIVTIQGLRRVLVTADVAEASLSGVHVGQLAQITFPAYPREQRTGVVDYIYPSLNAQSRTARVRITIPNPDLRLKDGMFANVTLQGSGGMALVVPSEAVIDTGRRQVVIVRRNGNFIPQEVRVGRDYAEWTEILAGLRRGEEVVASGQFLIDSEASLSGVISRLQSTQAPAPATATSRGIITAVNTAGGTVTISHEAIPAMRWPAMAMTFKLAQPGMARGLRKGLRVTFAVETRPRGGSYVVRRITPEGGR
jgi:Cu(I)/Ag(I) efflux system membrane fusion protein